MGNVDRVLAAVVGGLLLLPLAACSRFRESAPSGLPVSAVVAADELYGVRYAGPEPAGEPASYWPTIGMPADDTPDVQPAVAALPPRSRMFPRLFGDASATGERLVGYSEGDDGTVPFGFRYAAALADDAEPAPVLAPPPDPLFDVGAISADDGRDRPGPFASVRSEFQQGWWNLRADHRNYYNRRTMRDLFLGVGGAAVLANTSLDDDFHGWYQRDVRSTETDNFSSFWKTFGEGQIFIPAYAGLAVVGGLFDDRPLIGGVGDYSDRVTRAYLVGTPPMLLMQMLLGGSRPDECGVGSQWKPFDDNNAVSGHAFIGAVPFITAAKTVDNPWMKAAFYTMSTFPAWSRVNDDAHYASQVCLGWWMAYLACRAVDDTAEGDRCYSFTPLLTPEVTGLGVVVRR